MTYKNPHLFKETKCQENSNIKIDKCKGSENKIFEDYENFNNYESSIYDQRIVIPRSYLNNNINSNQDIYSDGESMRDNIKKRKIREIFLNGEHDNIKDYSSNHTEYSNINLRFQGIDKNNQSFLRQVIYEQVYYYV